MEILLLCLRCFSAMNAVRTCDSPSDCTDVVVDGVQREDSCGVATLMEEAVVDRNDP